MAGMFSVTSVSCTLSGFNEASSTIAYCPRSVPGIEEQDATVGEGAFAGAGCGATADHGGGGGGMVGRPEGAHGDTLAALGQASLR